jgi:hypothetical protein
MSAAALLVPTAAYAQGADVLRLDQTYAFFNPCTHEDVQVTLTRVYLSNHAGDQTHTARGTGVGLTTGTAYVFTQQVFDTRGRGGYEIIHLLAPGPVPDLGIRDDPFDVVDPVVTCT